MLSWLNWRAVNGVGEVNFYYIFLYAAILWILIVIVSYVYRKLKK